MNNTINEAKIAGNVGEFHVVQLGNGKRLANISVATEEQWKDAGGRMHERTDWHRVVCLEDRMIDVIEQAGIGRGASVIVVGKLQCRKLKAGTDQERTVTEIIVNRRGSISVIRPATADREQESRAA